MLNGLGYLLAQQGILLDEAEQLVSRALAHEPDNGAFLDSLGWVYYRQGRYPEAQDLLERAVARLPDPEVLEHLGDVYEVRGDWRAARRAWEQGLKCDPALGPVREKLKRIKRR